MKTKILPVILGILLTTAAYAGKITAQINTNTVVEGDSFQLIISSDGTGESPNLSPIQQNFDIVGTSKSSNMSIINGDISQKTEWVITLLPKNIGELTIPAISAGNDNTQPLKVKVLDASQAPKSQGATDDVTLTSRINGTVDKFYVFQEIPLTLRIETSQPIFSLSITEPQIEGVELKQSGKDRQSQITQNGRIINIIEVNYTLRAQKSGEVTIKPFTLKGEISDGRRRDPLAELFGGRSPFGGLGSQRGKPFSVRGNTLTFNVEDKKSTGENEWFLPAKAVKLKTQWQQQNPTFKVGEAVTRQISLLALGALPEQLPTLNIPDINGLKVYVDSDITDQMQLTDGIAARRMVTLSIVPEYGGEFTLPEISVNWHNTETDKAEVATLPSETITVTGATTTQTIKDNVQSNSTLEAQPQSTTPSEKIVDDKQTNWLWIISGIAVILGALVYAAYRRNYPKDGVISEASAQKDVIKDIKLAISTQDTRQLYQALLAYKQINGHVSAQFSSIQKLVESVLFGSEKNLDFVMIEQELNQLLTNKSVSKTNKESTSLPKLYHN